MKRRIQRSRARCQRAITEKNGKANPGKGPSRKKLARVDELIAEPGHKG